MLIFYLKIIDYVIIKKRIRKGSEFMSPLAKEVIEKLSHEEDNEVLAEVLDFYEYLKQKKQKQLKKVWDKIEEDEPSSKEIKLVEEYKSSKFISGLKSNKQP